ncbi:MULTISPECIES: twin-arginine translocase TatA/TatE family subunit [Pontibacter]|uniref:Sec-independent protein translocase protein TatA n=2 Tax=Pontibacter TaxID=323449 RepID=A0A1N7ACQ2_9BACT|nr:MULTISPECIES: twin-arginine translocase TatA/TatE family subunit [Pontibacter]EJF10775.1 twin arginine-targeting protein translocase [Pontibacter sp. BAB1700]MBF8963471.1 twin-arginine translocase TatA/TatE family subunit [Pontibacter sp. FD36]PVY37235.1 sec-independent protein translocase protein TatA [Pontibacter virosus]SIR36862.1 sec-independent protein translocase protein TatA [Pontibacter lucknowensis]
MILSAILLFLADLGGGEILVVLTAVLLLFGADKLPGMARSAGRGLRSFNDAKNEIQNELERSIKDIKKPE